MNNFKDFIYEVYSKTLYLIPNWLTLFILNFLSIFLVRYRKNIKPFIKKEKQVTNNNLVIIDVSKAFGDVLIWITLLKKLDQEKEKQYYCLVNIKYKKLMENLKFDKINFLYTEIDFGNHYNRKKYTNTELYSVVNDAINFIPNKNIVFDNVYIMALSATIEHYIYLWNVQYNNLHVFYNKKKFKILRQVDPYKQINLLIFFIRKFKNFNVIKRKIDNELNCIENGFKMFGFDYKNINYFSISNNKEKNIKKVSIMPFSSSYKKDLKLNILKNYMNDYYEKDNDILFCIYGVWNNEKQKIWDKEFGSSPLPIKMKINKFSNPYDFMNDVSNSNLIITNDTSMHHIGMIYNIETLIFFNESFNNKDFNWEKYWLGYKMNYKTIKKLKRNLFIN